MNCTAPELARMGYEHIKQALVMEEPRTRALASEGKRTTCCVVVGE